MPMRFTTEVTSAGAYARPCPATEFDACLAISAQPGATPCAPMTAGNGWSKSDPMANGSCATRARTAAYSDEYRDDPGHRYAESAPETERAAASRWARLKRALPRR